MPQPLAILFPGQGSQSSGMLNALAECQPLVRETFAEASDALGRDLWTLVSTGPAEALDQTVNTQPAMLAAGVAVWRVWCQAGGAQAAVMAGHSLGEYTALVAAGAIDFADAIRLAARRAALMQDAVPAGAGAMAAILGLDDAEVIALCRTHAGDEVLSAANFNAPGQVVIAGARAAVDRAIVAAKAAGAKRALALAVSVPSHCALMRPAAERLREDLDAAPLRLPTVPVLHNASVSAATTVEDLRARLIEQLYSPVRWVETVRAIAGQGVVMAIEAAPGKVLTGLNKRIDKQLTTLPVFDPKTLEAALEATAHA